MAAMMKVWTSQELYPPDITDDVRQVLRLLTNDRAPDGRAWLRRELDGQERTLLQGRLKTLLPWLTKPGSPAGLHPILLAMFVGFGGKSETQQESAIKASQYSYVMSDLPPWAVKRACDRFNNGSVKPEEVGAKKLDVGYAPSTAQLHIVARALVDPLMKERRHIVAALDGVADEPRETSAEHAAGQERIGAMVKKTAEAMAAGRLLEIEQANKRRTEILGRLRERSLADRRAEYRAAGLDPPDPGPDGLITSLPMMLKAGWQIQSMADHNVLTAPANAPPAPRKTQNNEMGS